VPDTNDLRLRVLRDKHDHILSGHFGQAKTLELVRRDYIWPGLRSFVRDFCLSCIRCKRAKPVRHKPYGNIRQLPIPQHPWHSISMDFIEQLPDSHGFTSILVIVDRLTKQALFIPTVDKVTSEMLAEIFVLHVFSKHGVPSHVTSDRGTKFTSHFFRSLGELLDMKLHFTSGYLLPGCTSDTRCNPWNLWRVTDGRSRRTPTVQYRQTRRSLGAIGRPVDRANRNRGSRDTEEMVEGPIGSPGQVQETGGGKDHIDE
jgi:hypothetical protein